MLIRWLRLFPTLVFAVLIGCQPVRSASLHVVEAETGGGGPAAAETVPLEPPPGFITPALPGPVAALAARTASLQTLTARLKLKVEVRGRKYSGIALAALRRPDYFRIDVYHVLGFQFLTLAREGDTVTLVDYSQQRFLIATRETLPEKYRGWFALWDVFPAPDTVALTAARWVEERAPGPEPTGADTLPRPAVTTWVGWLGEDTGQQYRLEVNGADPRLDRITFLTAGEELGTLILSGHEGAYRLPQRFELMAEGLVAAGELLEVQANQPLEPAPVVIPAHFQPVQP